MTTTCFNQVLGAETIRIAIPVTKITKIMDKVDRLIETGKLKAVRKYLAPYVTNEAPKAKEIVMSNSKGSKKEAALSLIAKLQDYGRDRGQIIKQLQHDLDMTYANARHYVVNVAKV